MVKGIKGKAALEKWEPGMLALGNGYAVILKNKKQFKEKPGWECEYLGYPEGTLYRCFTTSCVPGRNPTPTLLKKSGVRRQAGVNGDGRVPDSDNDDEDEEEEEEDIAGSNSLAKKANDDAQRNPVAVKIGNGASTTAKKDVQDREIDDGIGGSNDGEQGKKTEEFDEACRDIADYVGAPTVAGDDPIRKEEKTQEENGDGDCHAVGHVGVGPSAPSFLIQSERRRNGSGGIPEFEGRTNRRRLFNEVADFEDPQPPPKMARQEERAEGWVAWGMRKVAGFFS
ncbi:hypothetical protein CAEBREN_06256 [Caenorhabditis brenneri]|uniref:Uncharacterized protein n=1 Tax=Caenorhabditis brenneri TaxID=135651 RepID=G0MHQ8_CAEBE|nr:hypothetical protein CAEBREN_06256 [Caenorhabditis brenneri]